MYQDEFSAMTNAAAAKVGLLKKNPLGYFLMSMLAGAYIGFGILLIFTESGLMAGNPAAKIVMGASFCVALSLVIIAGAELFTGNTMVMTAGVLEGKISAFAKMSAGFVPLVSRGILGNILVCLTVWCGFRVKNESAKILMCFWCLFAFITTGFEHSIANMTLLTSALLVPAGQAVSVNGWIFNLAAVTLGNIIGGAVFVALPYYVASRQK